MNTEYNTISYLTTNDLNDIEDAIEELTEDIQTNIYNNQQSPLRNIQIGDDLSGKTLYLSFPRNSYENIINDERIDVITIDENKRIAYIKNNEQPHIYYRYNNVSYNVYAKKDADLNPYINLVRTTLPYDFGIVTDIDDNDEFYQYIKIYDDEDIMPDYIKHTYSNNEIITMQNIDNLENGIKNIGYYFYRPSGWENTIDWLGDKQGVNMKNISYRDLNRWIRDLNLINFDNLDKLNLWNTNLLHIIWDTPYEEEWEDL